MPQSRKFGGVFGGIPKSQIQGYPKNPTFWRKTHAKTDDTIDSLQITRAIKPADKDVKTSDGGGLCLAGHAQRRKAVAAQISFWG